MWEPGKPSQNENEYFARQDAEWVKSQRAKLDAERATKQPEQKQLDCPRCDGHLAERSFHDVTIDVCDTCRGVWLDGGELALLSHVGRAELQRVVYDIDTRK